MIGHVCCCGWSCDLRVSICAPTFAHVTPPTHMYVHLDRHMYVQETNLSSISVGWTAFCTWAGEVLASAADAVVAATEFVNVWESREVSPSTKMNLPSSLFLCRLRPNFEEMELHRARMHCSNKQKRTQKKNKTLSFLHFRLPCLSVVT